MIRYLKHKEIDKVKWGRCLDNSLNGLMYAYSWYLDIVCKDWDALVEDDYTGIMPLPKGEKYGVTYTYPPPFTQQLGLFSTNKITEKDAESFLSAIPAEYKYIEMNLNEQNQLHPGLFKIKKGVTHLLNLNEDYKNIFANYSTQTKRNLKKALSSSLTISANVPPQKVIDLFKANRGKQFEYPQSHYALLENLMKAIIDKGLGCSMGVFDSGGNLCAGAFFLESKSRTIFLFSGANETAFEKHAMTFLINKYLEEKSGQSIVFDFEGSLDKDLARFYSGFGSKRAEFLQVRRNMLKPPLKWLKELQYKRKASPEN